MFHQRPVDHTFFIIHVGLYTCWADPARSMHTDDKKIYQVRINNMCNVCRVIRHTNVKSGILPIYMIFQPETNILNPDGILNHDGLET